MMQKFENKMELQINSLETRIEKMQEMFNKGSERSPGEGKGNPLQYSCLEIPWAKEPGALQSRRSQRVGHN